MAQEFNSVNDQFSFGKYKGKTLMEVNNSDREYLTWCLKNIDGFKFDVDINSQLNLRDNEVFIFDNNLSTDKTLYRFINDIINLKLKKDILTEAYPLLETQKPTFKDIWDEMKNIGVYNAWINKTSLAAKMIKDSDDILNCKKNEIIEYCKSQGIFDGNFLKHEFFMNCQEDDVAICMTIQKALKHINSDFSIKIDFDSQSGRYNIDV